MNGSMNPKMGDIVIWHNSDGVSPDAVAIVTTVSGTQVTLYVLAKAALNIITAATSLGNAPGQWEPLSAVPQDPTPIYPV